MPNEVNITITGTDLSGPAFSGAIANMAKLRAAAKALSQDLGNMTLNVDPAKMSLALQMLKNKIQSLGIADLADVNVPIGRITAQLMVLKRLINQAGISDLLDVNLNEASLTQQLAKIKSISETIPVGFDVNSAGLAGIASEIAAIHLPKLGETVDVTGVSSFRNLQTIINEIGQGLNADTHWAGLLSQNLKLLTAGDAYANISNLNNIIKEIGMSFGADTAWARAMAKSMDDVQRASLSTAATIAAGNVAYDRYAMLEQQAAEAGSGGLFKSIAAVSQGLRDQSPLVINNGWGWNLLLGKVKLFGGVLSAIPFLATVGGLHLAADAVLEVAAEFIPATVAVLAFGAAAVPTVQQIVAQEKAMYTVTQAFGLQMPGLSGGFQKIADSVQPNVYVLFGEALGVINQKTGVFSMLAKGAGEVLDSLGARAAIALGSSGMSGFLTKGISDLQTLGDIVANVFGMFGGLLKTLPGYAELLFGALKNVTGALEAIANTGAVQGILRLGLELHGAVLWGGLAVTALVALRGPLASLGLWFAGTAISVEAYIGSIIAADGATATFAAILAPLAAINPFVWVAVGIGALTALTVWLVNSKTAAQNFFNSINSETNSATSFLQVTNDFTQGIQGANQALKNTPHYIDVMTGASARFGGLVTSQVNPALAQWHGVIGQLSGATNLQAERLAQLNLITGGTAQTEAAFNAIGLKNFNLAGMSAGAYANVTEQVKAYEAATVQLAGFTAGPAAAAQNALTNEFMNSTLPAIQKVTAAQDQLLNTIVGGRQSWLSFEDTITGASATLNTPPGLANAAKVAGANIGGLNAQSQALANSFYSYAVPAAQKLIDSLQQQGISTRQLTIAVADEVKQMLPFIGNNIEAKSVLVDMINNALGPGTVSLQNLNKWVGQNSGSLNGFNSIVAQSTIRAGNLTGVLNGLTNQMYAQDLLLHSKLSPDMNAYTAAVDRFGANSPQAHAALQTLNSDMNTFNRNTGLAITLPPQLQRQIDGLHGKTITLHLAAGPDVISIRGTGAYIQGESGHIVASGYASGTMGAAPGWGWVGEKGPELVKFSGGEQVLPAYASGTAGAGLALAGDFMEHFGGELMGNFMAGAGQSFRHSFEDTLGSRWSRVGPPPGAPGSGGTPGNLGAYSSIAAYVLKILNQPLRDVPVVMAQMQTESGGNPYAINRWDINWQEGHPSVGLMQVIAGTYAGYGAPRYGYPTPVAYGVSENPLANIYAGMAYAVSRYGSDYAYGPPTGWTQVLGHGHGYDQGGWLSPGMNLAYNGTGKPEWVSPPNAIGGPGGLIITIDFGPNFRRATGLSQAMIDDIKYTVRTRAGGDVQTMFGRE